MLAAGIDSGHGQVAAAAARMAGAATLAGGRGAAGAGAGGQIVIEFNVPREAAAMLPPSFWTAFQQGVRVRGGDPRIVTTKVSALA
jgi:hypothetical protein